MFRSPEKFLLNHVLLVHFSNQIIHGNANEDQEQQKNAILFFMMITKTRVFIRSLFQHSVWL